MVNLLLLEYFSLKDLIQIYQQQIPNTLKTNT